MGSLGNQNVWASYYTSTDCTQGVCSIACPQFCYLFFPPPPPDDDHSSPFSPLIIAVIGVMLSGVLLVSYYSIVTRFCRRRNDQIAVESSRDLPQVVASNGVDESVMKRIRVLKYQKGNGVIEGSDCAVCLSEFEENESLRLLPNCNHAFHLPCIDVWLKSQSSCPLCRANVAVFRTGSVPVKANIDPECPILVLDRERRCREGGDHENGGSSSGCAGAQCGNGRVRRDVGSSKGCSSE